MVTLDHAKVEVLHERFVNEVRPILVARGRNRVDDVAQYVSMAATRSNEPATTVAERVLLNARKSRRYPLAFWASDTRVLHKAEAINQVAILIDYYRDRATLSEGELNHLDKLRLQNL